MSKRTTTTTAAIIATLYADGMTDRDTLILAAVEDGASLNMATNAYAAFAKEAGITATVTSYKAEVLEGLSVEYDVDNWDADAVKEEVVRIVTGYSVAESTARDYCKAFSTLIGVVHPVLNPREAIFEWFRDMAAEGSPITKKGFMEYAKSLGRSQSNANEYWKGYELHLYLVG
jgi:hypothetical protein